MGDAPLVFVSYSRDDAEWRRRVIEMLAPVVRERRLDVWSDERLLVGERWRPQLGEAIGRSRAALLLVSGPFLASDFIVKEEVPALQQQGATLVCALLRPCLWDEVGWLAELQWAHDPRRDGAIVMADDPEGQIVRVCKRLLELLPASAVGAAPDAASRRGPRDAAPAVARLVAEDAAGRLVGVPPLPDGFVARDELGELRDAVLHGGDASVGITGKALGLHGQGGIGKTVLATALARDDAVRRHFPDGVHWVTAGERPDLVALQMRMLRELDAAHAELRSATEGVKLLRAALAQRRCLVVVDDVWSAAAARAFAAAGPHGRVLYTTRDEGVLRAAGAEVRRVDVLPQAAARELLAGLTGTDAAALPVEADAIVAATGRVALALALVGAAIGRGGRGWREVAAELSAGAQTFLDHPYANTFKAMQVAVSGLNAELAAPYESLAVYPEDARVPVAAVARYWSHVRGLDLVGTRARLTELAERELLSLDGEEIAFHDLQRDFLLLRAPDVALLHEDLLASYRALLPTPDSPWRRLPDTEPYIWEHLLHHLRGAGDGAGIAATASDVAYLALRAFRSGPHAAEADVRTAAELLDDGALRWLVRLFEQWGHLLADQRSAADLAVTLASRLHGAPARIDVTALDELLPDVHPRVRWGLRRAPSALQRVLEGHTNAVWEVAFAPDGCRLASAGEDGTVRLWDATTGQHTVLGGHTDAVQAVAFAPDGYRLATASADGTVRLWDPTTGQHTNLVGHTGCVWAVAFAADGRRLASAGDDRTVRLWNTITGQQHTVLEGHVRRVRAVAFAPDGRHVASASSDRTVRLWDATTSHQHAVTEGHTGSVDAVAFAPDGHRLASAGDDHTVRLWNTITGQQHTVLEGHVRGVRAVAFAPDGCRLASAGADRTVRLWDATTGHQHAVLEGHTGGGAGGRVCTRRTPPGKRRRRPHGAPVGRISRPACP